jgi:hypothetical protein
MSTTNSTQSFSTRLENWLKVVGAAAGLIYAVGFLVINVYLARFGVRDFQLFSAHFISAGIVTVVVLLSPLLGFSIIVFLTKAEPYKDWLSNLNSLARRFAP